MKKEDIPRKIVLSRYKESMKKIRSIGDVVNIVSLSISR